jgi:hypothetical protein
LEKYDLKPYQVLAVSIDSARNITKAVDDFITFKINGNENDHGIQENFTLEDEDEDEDEQDLCENSELFISESEQEMEEVEENLEFNGNISVRVHCVVHKLQLAVVEFISKDKQNKALLSHARNVVKKLRTGNMRNVLKQKGFKMAIVDVVTRWNSTYLMLKRLVELRDFCDEYKSFDKNLSLTEDQWNKIINLLEILRPVAELTSRLQYEQLDVSQFIAFWKFAMFQLEQNPDPKAAILRKMIQKREEVMFENEILVAGMYLDKRFHNLLTYDQKAKAEDFIFKVWAKQKLISNINEEKEPEDVEIVEPVVSNSNYSNFENYIQIQMQTQGSASSSSYSQTSQTNSTKNSLQLELEKYSQMPSLNADLNYKMIEYWKLLEDLPILREIVLNILAAPVTEVSVERMFSHLNFILNPRRNRLKNDILEDIMFLRLNDRFLN